VFENGTFIEKNLKNQLQCCPLDDPNQLFCIDHQRVFIYDISEEKILKEESLQISASDRGSCQKIPNRDMVIIPDNGKRIIHVISTVTLEVIKTLQGLSPAIDENGNLVYKSSD